MKINILIFICSIAFILGAALLWQNQSKEMQPHQPAADFTAETLDGNRITLSNYKNKNILLHFWATWCAPCIIELPKIMKMANENPEIIILAVSVENKPEDINKFLQKQVQALPENFIVVLDPKWEIAKNNYNVHQLPESFLISDDLNVKKHWIGSNDNWDNLKLYQ